MKKARFVLSHGNELSMAGTVLRFTYSGNVRGTSDADKWKLLRPPGGGRLPRDTLVLNCNTPHLRTRCNDVVARLRRTSMTPKPADSVGYLRADLFDATSYNQFSREVDALFTNHELEPYLRAWYDKEKFDFTIPEVVELFKNDQVIAGAHASIVLPGGGVRGAYQARILDNLYDHHLLNAELRNAERIRQSKDPRLRGRLSVESIIGTSGGALVGYLAARRGPRDAASLTSRWLTDGDVAVKPSQVFPWINVLRFFSILVASMFFGMVAAMAMRTGRSFRGAPLFLTISFAAILAAAPALIWGLSSFDVTYEPRYEGYAYAALIFVLHGIHTTLTRPRWRVVPLRSRRFLFAAIAAAVAGLTLALHVLLNPSLNRIKGNYFVKGKYFFTEPLLADIGIALLVAAAVLLAVYRGCAPVRGAIRAYVNALGTLIGFLATGAAVVAVIFTIDLATSLELTLEYWAAVILATILATSVWVFILPARIRAVRRGVRFWVQPLGARPFPYTSMLTLAIAGFLAVGAWILFVAPSLYSGEAGAGAFRKQAETVGAAKTRFIAAVTAPGTPMRAPRRLPPGDYYAYQVPPGDPIAKNAFLDYPETEFFNAVSASGSPFPIYPGRALSHKRGDAVFIDGGFTHLVPVEAAVLLGAKQVLIVANTARHDSPFPPPQFQNAAKAGRQNSPAAPKFKRRIFSLLLSDALRTFDLLFERSQLTDIKMERDVLVASIAPTWTDPDPFLMDFRPSKIRWLVDKAAADVSYERPGRVLSWGAPQPLDAAPPP